MAAMIDIDLSGDGGVVKRILRHAKPEAPSPSDATPIADGLLFSPGWSPDGMRQHSARIISLNGMSIT